MTSTQLRIAIAADHAGAPLLDVTAESVREAGAGAAPARRGPGRRLPRRRGAGGRGDRHRCGRARRAALRQRGGGVGGGEPASTSTKDPDLPDTYYVGRLAAPGTVNTMPEKTLLAVADHGRFDGTLQPDAAAARAVLALAAEHGVDTYALAANLQALGARAFAADRAHLLDTMREKSDSLVRTS